MSIHFDEFKQDETRPKTPHPPPCSIIVLVANVSTSCIEILHKLKYQTVEKALVDFKSQKLPMPVVLTFYANKQK